MKYESSENKKLSFKNCVIMKDPASDRIVVEELNEKDGSIERFDLIEILNRAFTESNRYDLTFASKEVL